jgi:hypothetical protein
MAVLSNLLLKTDTPIFCMSAAAAFLLSTGCSAMALGFGALFPKFSTSNIAKIESSPGGLIYMLAALFYIGLNMALWSLPVQNYYRNKLGGSGLEWVQLWWIAAALAIANAVAIGIPLWMGLRSLNKMEK